jgi:hypothetical protein
LGPDIDSAQLLYKPGVNQPIAYQYVSRRAANREARKKTASTAAKKSGLNGHLIPSGDQTAPKTRVRERSAAPAAHRDYQDDGKGLAHPSNRLVAQLNESWRVVDDPLQWMLQRRKGNPRDKNSGWRGRSFCRTREALLRCIREYCCSPDEDETRCIREYRGVDAAALQQVRAFPEWHIDWDYAPKIDVDDVPALPFADELPK